jgi:hypothetical protein
MLVYVETLNLLIYCRHLIITVATGPNNTFNSLLTASKVLRVVPTGQVTKALRVVPTGQVTKVMHYDGCGGEIA